MGIAGHILGERKLRRLSSLTGLSLDRAYIRGSEAEGRVVWGGRCWHFTIDPKTGSSSLVTNPIHWTSCPESCKAERET